MEGSDPVTGVLIVCGAIMFVSACVIVRVLRALDENDQYENDQYENDRDE